MAWFLLVNILLNYPSPLYFLNYQARQHYNGLGNKSNAVWELPELDSRILYPLSWKHFLSKWEIRCLSPSHVCWIAVSPWDRSAALPSFLSTLVDNATAFKGQIPGFQLLNSGGVEGQLWFSMHLTSFLTVFIQVRSYYRDATQSLWNTNDTRTPSDWYRLSFSLCFQRKFRPPGLWIQIKALVEVRVGKKKRLGCEKSPLWDE